jgi:methyl-accepting chemotaxis protein
MKWSLRNKILLSVGITIFIAQGMSTFVHMYDLRQSYRDALNLRFEALAQSLVANILERDSRMSVGSAQRNPHMIHTILQAASIIGTTRIYELNKEKGVSFIAVIDPDGVFAIHTEREKWEIPVESERLREYLQQHKQMTILDGDIYHTLVPVFAQDEVYLGTIDIGAPRALVDTQVRNLLLKPLGLWGVFLFVVFGVIVLLMRTFVTKPVGRLMEVMEHVETGSLAIQAPVMTSDELGQLAQKFNHMITQLRMLVSQVQQSGIQVTSASTELAATAKEQETTVSVQVTSTNRVLKAVQEISELTADLVTTMQQVASKSQETAGFASSGQTDLAHMEEAMQRMEKASLSISNRLQVIHEKAENITTVVTTITKVADQTNLLSLNAAIEAEKAGEYGRGFTVVAREIRRLADQTSGATLDIEQMVEQMQSAVTVGVMEMEKFIAEVRHSAEDVERISLQLTRIIEQVQALTPSFEDVNVAMEHQSEHAQEINHAVQQLSEEMQETKSSLHETYSAIAQLKEIASTLQQQVSQFKVT